MKFKNIVLRVIAIAVVFFILNSCKDQCEYTEEWDDSTTYVRGESVTYSGECYIAVNQGRGIIPGPWLENGNDIWELCTE